MESQGYTPPEEAQSQETSRTHETYPDNARFRDIFDSRCTQEFSDKLKASKGKAFFCVHPFYLDNTTFETHIEQVLNGSHEDPQLKQFWTELAVILPKLVKANIPIVFMQEMTKIESNFVDNSENLQEQHDVLVKNLAKLGVVDAGVLDMLKEQNFFVMYTDREGPHPLKTQEEAHVSTKELDDKRIGVLKEAGLKEGIISGGYLKPAEEHEFHAYAKASEPMVTWGGNKTEGTYGSWTLKDYYDEKRPNAKTLHPLQKIRLDQCTGEFMRMLAFRDINPVITRITFPDVVQVPSKYQERPEGGIEAVTPETIQQKEIERQAKQLCKDFDLDFGEDVDYLVAAANIQFAACQKARLLLGFDPKFRTDVAETPIASNDYETKLEIYKNHIRYHIKDLKIKLEQNQTFVPLVDPLTDEPFSENSLKHLLILREQSENQPVTKKQFEQFADLRKEFTKNGKKLPQPDMYDISTGERISDGRPLSKFKSQLRVAALAV